MRRSKVARSIVVAGLWLSAAFGIGCGGSGNGDAGADVPDMGRLCGNGVINTGERCDSAIPIGQPGACPFTCDDEDACTDDTLIGTGCQARCQFLPVTCNDGDGCCSAGCDQTLDDDCSNVCGNGIVETGETCDGSCPSACNDGDACTLDTLAGSAAACNAMCTSMPALLCAPGDGCCPSGCNANDDGDCTPSCGNGVVESGEECDGDCPTSCDDSDACTTDGMTGSVGTCSLVCTNTPVGCVDMDGCCGAGCNANEDDECTATCGNGVVEPRETCDGSCPTSCDDANECTVDALAGTPQDCDVLCTHVRITTCTSGDGCCNLGCTSTNDDDCPIVCGNGATEMGETCDGNCPATCDDGDPCTTDTRMGMSSSCDVVCDYTEITACANGDGCCAPGCLTMGGDDDCSPTCDNGTIEPPETCDQNCPLFCPSDGDGCTRRLRTGSSSQCNVICTQEPVTQCGIGGFFGDNCCPPGCDSNDDVNCDPMCGNDVVEDDEDCDGNCPTMCDEDGDPCTAETLVGTPATCDVRCTHPRITTCGDAEGCCPSSCTAGTDPDCG